MTTSSHITLFKKYLKKNEEKDNFETSENTKLSFGLLCDINDTDLININTRTPKKLHNAMSIISKKKDIRAIAFSLNKKGNKIFKECFKAKSRFFPHQKEFSGLKAEVLCSYFAKHMILSGNIKNCLLDISCLHECFTGNFELGESKFGDISFQSHHRKSSVNVYVEIKCIHFCDEPFLRRNNRRKYSKMYNDTNFESRREKNDIYIVLYIKRKQLGKSTFKFYFSNFVILNNTILNNMIKSHNSYYFKKKYLNTQNIWRYLSELFE